MSSKPALALALDPLEPVLATSPVHQRGSLTLARPENRDDAIFLHPGEPLFDRLLPKPAGH